MLYMLNGRAAARPLVPWQQIYLHDVLHFLKYICENDDAMSPLFIFGHYPYKNNKWQPSLFSCISLTSHIDRLQKRDFCNIQSSLFLIYIRYRYYISNESLQQQHHSIKKINKTSISKKLVMFFLLYKFLYAAVYYI